MTNMNSVKFFFTFFVLTAPALFAGTAVRTPQTSGEPHINGPSVIGVTPGNSFLYKIPVSGDNPIQITVTNLPDGVTLRNGSVLEGKISQPGDYRIKVTASGATASVSRILTIKAGSEIALTPPMGWNSWYNFSESVSDEKIRAVADAFVEQNLIDYGWSYVNIDDCWQGERLKEAPYALAGNEKFPDMKALCDYVHSKGLRIGIYHSPWIGTYAGFRGGSSDSETGADPSYAEPPEKRLQSGQIFGRYPGVHAHNADRVGKYWLFDEDLKAIADWGFDYIKVDWHPNDIPTAQRMHNGVRQSGRDIVLSFSNKAFLKDVPELSKYANLWRTSGDITDRWDSLSRISRDLPNWFPFTSSGKYNDPDMLQVGNLGKPNTQSETFRPTGLSREEQYFQVSLWVIAAAPLILSCDVSSLDDFTKGLLTNTEVLAVHQSYPVFPPQVRKRSRTTHIITRETENGTAVCVLNYSEQKKKVTVPFHEWNIGSPGKSGNSQKTATVRDLWRQRNLSPDRMTDDGFTVEIAGHGGELFLIR